MLTRATSGTRQILFFRFAESGGCGFSKNLPTQPVGDGPDGLGRMFDVGCDQQLKEIAVSVRGTLRGLTQFRERLALPRFKPLNAKEIGERLGKSSACAIIRPRPLATH